MTKGTGAKKVNAKKVAKAVEDKTFGLKNKGGKKNQAVAKQMSATMQGQMRKQQEAKNAMTAKKTAKAEREAELAALGLKAGAKKTATPAPGTIGFVAHVPGAVEIVEHEEKTEGRMLEDVIEEMRRNLGANLTRVTPETFAAWSAKKKKEKEEKRSKKQSKREKDIALGRVAMTGRELFDRKRNVFIDDERADEAAYTRDDEAAIFVASLEEQMRMDAESNETEFDVEKFHAERDRILAQIKADRAAKRTGAAPIAVATSSSAPSAQINVDSVAAALPIDESLFNEEELPDDLDEEEEEE